MKGLFARTTLFILILSALAACAYVSPVNKVGISTTGEPEVAMTASPEVGSLTTATFAAAQTALVITPTPDYGKGELFFTLSKGSEQPRLVKIPGTCAPCPLPVEIAGYPLKTAPIQPLSWSPDGQMAALVAPAEDNQPALWVFNPADSSWKALATYKNIAPSVFWSPDGKWIAWQAEEEGVNLYVAHSDGSELTNLTEGKLAEMEAVHLAGWLNSDQLLLSAGKAGAESIFTLKLVEKEIQPLGNGLTVFKNRAEGHLLLPAPDGSAVVYVDDASTLKLVRTEGGDPKVLVNMKDNVLKAYAWAPKGDWLAFTLQNGESIQLYLVRPDGSELHVVYTAATLNEFVFSPYGDELAIVLPDNGGQHIFFIPYSQGQPKPMNTHSKELDSDWLGVSWRITR